MSNEKLITLDEQLGMISDNIQRAYGNINLKKERISATYKDEEFAELQQASRFVKGYLDYSLERIKEFNFSHFSILKILFHLREYNRLITDSRKVMNRWTWITNKMDRIAKSYKGEM